MSFGRLRPGHYHVYLLTDEPVYLQSARLGDQDVTSGGITLDGSPTNVLEIQIGCATAVIEGAVVSGDGATAASADVKLIAQGQDSKYVFKSVQAKRDGGFSFVGVPPGAYDIVALNRLVRDVELGPLEFSRMGGLTKHIVVGDSARLTVQLQLSVFRP